MVAHISLGGDTTCLFLKTSSQWTCESVGRLCKTSFQETKPIMLNYGLLGVTCLYKLRNLLIITKGHLGNDRNSCCPAM